MLMNPPTLHRPGSWLGCGQALVELGHGSALAAGLRLRGRFQERLQRRSQAAGRRFQEPCRRVRNGWRAMGGGRHGLSLPKEGEGGSTAPLQARALLVVEL